MDINHPNPDPDGFTVSIFESTAVAVAYTNGHPASYTHLLTLSESFTVPDINANDFTFSPANASGNG